MGARGRGANVYLLARNASRNANIRPGRKRKVHFEALDKCWKQCKPADGSRYRAFEKALLRVAGLAADIGIDSELFDEWAGQLLFDVDDRDRHVDP